MKPEIYKQAIKNLQSRISLSIIREIPTLDYVMDADKMSKTDRIFYEAYKLYGNRNHTWQDFKEMFNGDVKLMQKTVKHWRTWDQINQIKNQQNAQEQIVENLMTAYGIDYIDDDNKDTYISSHPDLVAEFDKLLNLGDMLVDNYSTFDAEISKIEREFEKKQEKIPVDDSEKRKKLIIEYIDKMYEIADLRNADFVTAERVEEYRNIILSNPKILSMAKNFDNLLWPAKVNFARLILNESAIQHGVPVGSVIQDDAPDGPHILDESQAAGYSAKLKTFLLRASSRPAKNLSSFLQALAHEDNHRIDYYNTPKGMIGTQLMNWAAHNYFTNDIIGDDEYMKQITELSSYYLDETTGNALDRIIVRHRD